MSTAVDTAFEELMSASVAEPEALHYVCTRCWPDSLPPGVAVALCGHQTRGAPESGFHGRHACAKCLAVHAVSPLPCGHP